MSDETLMPEIDILQLGERQIYPVLDRLTPEYITQPHVPLIDKTTRIASIGSCFAREIKNWLLRHDYNYVQTSDHPAAIHSSAAFGQVYSSACLRQIVAWAFGVFTYDEVWRSRGVLLDPYRKDVGWHLWQDWELLMEKQREEARLAFTECDVLVVTVGLAEVWGDGSRTFYQVPPKDVYDPGKHEFRLMTSSEVANDLFMMALLVNQSNPDCQIIFTVSPVPLRATFRKDVNVVVANAESKAVVRAGVGDALWSLQEVARCHYFPAYELVMQEGRYAFREDNRHVKREVVDDVVMAGFIRMFGKGNT